MSTVEEFAEIDLPADRDTSIPALTMSASMYCTNVMPLTRQFATTGGFSTPETVATFIIDADDEDLDQASFDWYAAPVSEKIAGRIVRGFWFCLNPYPFMSITVGVDSSGFVWSRDVIFGQEAEGEMLTTDQLLQVRDFARTLWGAAWDFGCPDGGETDPPHTHALRFAPTEG